MRSNYLLSGIAAIALALIFPVYWVLEIFNDPSSTWNIFRNQFSVLEGSDLVFVFMGLLSIFIYLSFKKVLNDRLNFKKLDAILWVMIAIVAIFHIGTVALEAILGFTETSPESGLGILATVGIICFVIFGALDILIGLILIRYYKQVPNILIVLAVVSIVQGIFEISVVSGLFTVVTFPIYLVILAIYFFNKPETIEVV